MNASTVSRWENAHLSVSYQAARRYEAALDLSPGLLITTIDTTHRFWARFLSYRPALHRDVHATAQQTSRRLDALLDRACSTATMRGADWDELTVLLAAMPRIFMPDRIWTELASRLLVEQTIADGVPWFQRFEAFNRLLSHPVGQQAAVAACASSGSDRSNRILVEAICGLDCSGHSGASHAVLTQLEHPTAERAQQGALMACVRKLQYNHFTIDQIRRIVRVVDELLTDPTRSETRSLAVELVASQPTALAQLAPKRLQELIGQRRNSRHHPALLAGASAQVVNRILNTVTALQAVHAPPPHDDVFALLVSEMLYGDTFDIRLYAGSLIAATPYRQPLATALGLELTAPRGGHDAELMAALITALRFLGGPREREIIEQLVVAPSTPRWLRRMATCALGHVGGTTSPRYWKAAVRHHGQQWRTYRNSTSAAVLDALAYSLGMTRNRPMLVAVRDDASGPAPARAAAAWWLNLPTHIWQSSA